ncbi:MAG: DNA-directed RNA polymerase subunit beta [bacterium]|nr:DNA-directed RNA polymerase subunit beta [bacterium]
MVKSSINPKDRVFLSRKTTVLPELDLKQNTRQSFQWFIDQGIQEKLTEVSPIIDYTGKNWEIHFGNYRLGKPKYTPEEALEKDTTYEVPLWVKTTLVNKKTGKKVTQELFFGNLPYITPKATFIISGVERAIINQLVRSPGVYLSQEEDISTRHITYSAEIRPIRGTWLEFIITNQDTLLVRVDRRRKMPATLFLRCLGLSTNDQILDFYKNLPAETLQIIRNTLSIDPTNSYEEALIHYFQEMRPGEPVILANAIQSFKRTYFSTEAYYMGRVGRYKLNKRLGLDIPNTPENWALTEKDVFETLKRLALLYAGQEKVDDIDHLGNRRLRSVGELLTEGPIRIGLIRMERAIKERMSLTSPNDDASPSNLVNSRPLFMAINEFFRLSRLSTLVDQTNPLSELDNIRRVTVLGAGGITRERASFSIRDVHTSQYSRICPVRTPEGPNVGLVVYLALYAKVDEYGFLLAPYRRVVKQKVNGRIKMKITDEIVYLDTIEEENYHITHSEVNIDENGYITDKLVPLRYKGKFLEGSVYEVDFIDTAGKQVVGASASLIPFLQHDEATRALMGSHMQCQAVPLVIPEAPIVGTGMEKDLAIQSQAVILANNPGKVEYVDGDKVVVKINRKKSQKPPANSGNIKQIGDREIYYLDQFKKTTQRTCFSHRPVVNVGDHIKPGQLIADGPACDNGELALGKNLTIAYCSYDGLGYEDAFVISDKLIKDDTFTSITIEEYEADVVDTQLGPEELTRDIPNVAERDLKNLAEDGIIVIGAEVGPNDILVGKIAPKGESELSAEERLLRAIFGEKAREVRDTSLRMPHGERGIVIGVRILDRKKGDELDPGVLKRVIVKVAQLRKIAVGDKLAGRHGNKGVISKIVPAEDMPFMEDGTPVDIILDPLAVLKRMNLGQIHETMLGMAGAIQGKTYAKPTFEKVKETIIEQELKKSGYPVSGKVNLFDGRTGEPLHSKVLVGKAYILKLIHMVEDKVHARSIGPYSLVTQQPLGGKAQMGGQRVGEMEVWALEAHRAAHVLQEMLTIKSDDVYGRAKAYEAIIKGVDIPAATVPESFKVLMKELNSLALNVTPIQGMAVEEDEDKDSKDDIISVLSQQIQANHPADDKPEEPPQDQPSQEEAAQPAKPADKHQSKASDSDNSDNSDSDQSTAKLPDSPKKDA